MHLLLEFASTVTHRYQSYICMYIYCLYVVLAPTNYLQYLTVNCWIIWFTFQLLVHTNRVLSHIYFLKKSSLSFLLAAHWFQFRYLRLSKTMQKKVESNVRNGYNLCMYNLWWKKSKAAITKSINIVH